MKALAMILLASLGWYSCRHEHDAEAALVRLVRATSAQHVRLFEGRPTGGFSYQPVGHARGRSLELVPDVRIVAAEIEKHASENPTPSWLNALAIARLVAGDTAGSIDSLEIAGANESNDPVLLNNLAAALLSDERSGGRLLRDTRAFDLATRATRLDSSLSEGWFNRALAASRIPAFDNLTPWNDAAVHERDAAWMRAIAEKRELTTRHESSCDQSAWLRTEGALLSERVDAHTIRDAVERCSQHARLLLEDRLIGEWLRALTSGDASTAARWRARGTAIADALQESTHDNFGVQIIHHFAQLRGADQRTAALGVAAYARGRVAYEVDDYDNARRPFEQAVAYLEQIHSPLTAAARANLASVLYQQKDFAGSLKQLDLAQRLADSRGFVGVSARCDWIAALVHWVRFEPVEALDRYSRALERFAAIGDDEQYALTANALADNFRALGQTRNSWKHLADALDRFDEVQKPLRRYLLLFNGALFSMREGLNHAALAWQTLAIDEARKRQNPGPIVEGLTYRARILQLLGDTDAARQAVSEAEHLVSTMPGGSLRRYLDAELNGEAGVIAAGESPDVAVSRLTHAVTFFERAEPPQVPRLLLQRGNAFKRQGDTTRAQADFETACAWFEKARASLREEYVQISAFDEGWDVFHALETLQWKDLGNPTAAFATAERGRGRSLATSEILSAVASPDGVAQQMPSGRTLVSFVEVGDRLHGWVITRGASHTFQSPIRTEELQRLLRVHQYGLRGGTTGQALREASRQLHAALVEPWLQFAVPDGELVIVPDAGLGALPFAALLDARGRYLIESHAVSMMPSAAAFVRRQNAESTNLPHAAKVLLIGNPATDDALGLPPLAAARDEVKALGALYPDHRILLESAATKTAFLRDAGQYEIVHFAGHAEANQEFPDLSRLFFAGSAAESSLLAREVTRMTFDRTRLLILAGCETGAGPVSKTEGILSLARPFLRAGVPAVIASTSPIDDVASSRIMVWLHSALARGLAPAAALREAQRHAIASAGFERDPRNWANFFLAGGD
jgi:CHAT domain-containing protein